MKFEIKVKNKVVATFESPDHFYQIVQVNSIDPKKIKKIPKDNYIQSLIETCMRFEELSDWDSTFLDSVYRQDSLSEKQINKINKIHKHYDSLKGVSRG